MNEEKSLAAPTSPSDVSQHTLKAHRKHGIILGILQCIIICHYLLPPRHHVNDHGCHYQHYSHRGHAYPGLRGALPSILAKRRGLQNSYGWWKDIDALASDYLWVLIFRVWGCSDITFLYPTEHLIRMKLCSSTCIIKKDWMADFIFCTFHIPSTRFAGSGCVYCVTLKCLQFSNHIRLHGLFCQ